MPIIFKNSFLEEIDEPEDAPVPRSASVPSFALRWADAVDAEFEVDQFIEIEGLEHGVFGGGKDKQEIAKLVQTGKFGSSDASLRSTSKRASCKANAYKSKASMVKTPMAKPQKAFRDKRPQVPKKSSASSDLWQHASMKCRRTMISKEETEDNECWICGSAYCRPSECQNENAPAKRERRFMKRRQTIDTIKAKLHYIIYTQNVARDQRTIRSPMTPPAEDIYDIPTRMWKHKTLQWDIQLKQNEWGLDAIHIEPEI